MTLEQAVQYAAKVTDYAYSRNLPLKDDAYSVWDRLERSLREEEARGECAERTVRFVEKAEVA